VRNQIVNVIGGGLAGVEAAWQAAGWGAKVRLYEMRPVLQTPAHRTDKLAEIVCSNSLKTDEPGSAPYLLKEELRRGGSLVMEAAAATRVPAGAALSVDRIKFAELITEKVEAHPNIEIVREEVKNLSEPLALAGGQFNWEWTFEQYSANRKPNTDAIQDMAEENFYEMRGATADPVFQRKRQLETKLEQTYPDYFSKYSMVTFREDLPYAVAKEKGNAQDRLLMDICSQEVDIEGIDIEETMREIRDLR